MKSWRKGKLARQPRSASGSCPTGAWWCWPTSLSWLYQGFIDSVRDLLRVRSEATQLKKEVESIDCEVRASSAKVISGAEKLVKARTTETNIAATIEALSLCLPGRSLNQRTAE